MKKLICILTVFLLCAVCISGASAFTYVNPAVVNPSGSLSPGETITVSMEIEFPEGSPGGDTTLTTDLEDVYWTVDGYVGNDPRGSIPESDQRLTSITLKSWSWIFNKDDNDVKITLIGTVSDSDAGSSIVALSITQTNAPSGEYPTYSTLPQKVYNPDNFDSDAAAVEKRISAIEARIPTYVNYGIDMAQAESYVSTAKTKIAAAKSYGKSDITNAYANIEAADKQLVNVEMYIAGSALNFIKANTDQIKADIAALEEKGWNSEAAIIASSNQGIINLYTLAKATYEAGSVPDVDTNLADSFIILEKANKYIEDASKNPFAAILNYWWIILIVVGAAAVVAGIIFFIKRRGGSWDELG